MNVLLVLIGYIVLGLFTAMFSMSVLLVKPNAAFTCFVVSMMLLYMLPPYSE